MPSVVLLQYESAEFERVEEKENRLTFHELGSKLQKLDSSIPSRP